MAEAALVLSIVSASASLVYKCGDVLKTINDVAGKYKKAELSIKLLVQQVDALKAAWERISRWSDSVSKDTTTPDVNSIVLARLDQSLDCGNLVISALERDLITYNLGQNKFGLKQRSRVWWNDTDLACHQTRVRDQVLIMTLLLHVLELCV